MKYYNREPEGSLAHEIKSAPIEEIKQAFDGIEFKTEPKDHQWRALAVGALNDTWLFSLDMGLGKTKLGIDLANMKNSKALGHLPSYRGLSLG